MRNIAVCGSQAAHLMPDNASLQTVEIEDLPAIFGLITTPAPEFCRGASDHRHKVMVKVKAISCNYRDKSLILAALRRGGSRSYYILGSEFVGEVVDTGSEVSGLEVGDRVIGDNGYSGNMAAAGSGLEGIPTNHASREYQIFPQHRLIKIPPQMPDDVAAGFSIGAQTAYSMIRKLAVKPGTNVLVTAARSNTSLFVINALRPLGANIYATTTSPFPEEALLALGVKEVIRVDPQLVGFSQHKRLNEIMREVGPFRYIVDPFFDLHLGKVTEMLAPGGTYITCGLYDQHLSLLGKEPPPQELDLKTVMLQVFVRNLQIVGNCLGVTADLRQALDDYAGGRLHVMIDSIFTGNRVGEFFHRTYNAKDRLGKVIFRYS